MAKTDIAAPESPESSAQERRRRILSYLAQSMAAAIAKTILDETNLL